METEKKAGSGGGGTPVRQGDAVEGSGSPPEIGNKLASGGGGRQWRRRWRWGRRLAVGVGHATGTRVRDCAVQEVGGAQYGCFEGDSLGEIGIGIEKGGDMVEVWDVANMVGV